MTATGWLEGVDPVAEYAIRLGDDALILSHRLTEWVSRAPELEEDMALANIALDLLGQARTLLSYAGERIGRTEDDLAYLRGEREFRNAALVELPRGDFACTIVRQLLFSSYQYALYTRLFGSHDEVLAALAGKAVKEVAYHRDHATQWTLRLGDGTAESHRRMVDALESLWAYGFELFERDELVETVVGQGIGVDPSELEPEWRAYVGGVLDAAGLEIPTEEGIYRPTGGRKGLHTEALGYLLAEMQSVARAHPGATW